MQEIILNGVDEKVLCETLENGLSVYMLVNEKVNNFYMTLSVKYGSMLYEALTILADLPVGGTAVVEEFLIPYF